MTFTDIHSAVECLARTIEKGLAKTDFVRAFVNDYVVECDSTDYDDFEITLFKDGQITVLDREFSGTVDISDITQALNRLITRNSAVIGLTEEKRNDYGKENSLLADF